MAPVPVHAIDWIGVASVCGQGLLWQGSAAPVHPPLLCPYQQDVPLILQVWQLTPLMQMEVGGMISARTRALYVCVC